MADQQQLQAQIRSKLGQGIKDEFVQRNFVWYQGMALKGSMGSLLGWMAGRFWKQFSDVLAWWGGIAGIFLGWLHWCDYIKINFRKIDADILHLVAKANKSDEQGGFVRNIKKFFVHTLPLCTGFTAAFYYALEC